MTHTAHSVLAGTWRMPVDYRELNKVEALLHADGSSVADLMDELTDSRNIPLFWTLLMPFSL